MRELKRILMMAFVIAGLSVFTGCFSAIGIENGNPPSGFFDGNPFDLNPFATRLNDGNGIVYTLLAGSNDPDHMYGNARKVEEAYRKALACLLKNGPGFSLSYVDVKFTYSASWYALSKIEKQRAVVEMALQVAESTGVTVDIWHEVSTWSKSNIDFYSSFSWEDTYSNLLGAKIAVEAIKMGGNFRKNVTTLANKALKERRVVSRKEAAEITKTVEGKWYKPGFLFLMPQIFHRNMDIGVDGFINPTRIEIPDRIVKKNGYDEIGPAIPLAAPKLDSLDKYGVGVQILIKSSASKSKRIKELLGITRPIDSKKDFPRMMEILKKEAIEKYGFTVDD